MPLVTLPSRAPNYLLPARKVAWICLQLVLLGTGLVGNAHALSLGDITFKGYISAPLSIVIPVGSIPEEGLDPSCIHLVRPEKQSLDEIPWLGQAAIQIEGTGNRQYMVLKTRPIRQPVLRIGLEIDCGFNLRRDYTILLDPAPTSETPAITVANADTVQALSPLPVRHESVHAELSARGAAWQIQPGDTALNIAARLAPGNRSQQRRLADEILSVNSGSLRAGSNRDSRLPAGILIQLPPVPPLPAQASRPRHGHPVTGPTINARTAIRAIQPPERPAEPDTEHKAGDHLVVTGGPDAPLQLSRSLGAYDATAIRPADPEIQEQQLLAALDDKTATQIELRERLRQLSALQEKLQEQTARIETRLHQLAPTTPKASVPDATINVQVAPPLPPPVRTTGWVWWKILLIATGGMAVILAAGAGAYVLLRRRHSEFVAFDGDTLPLPMGPSESDAEIEKRSAPLSEADIWPDHEGRAPTLEEQARLPPISTQVNNQFTVTGLGSTSQLHVVEHDIDEHESAIELADIMLSFGRVQGAAQTLADYIRTHPTRAVRPWIKLLEVYQAAEMKVEFTALAQQINKHFNVKQVAWDQFNAVRYGPDTLEHLPHIATKLEELWGTRDCQSYLYRLLHDNRNGTRQGFSIAIIDEITLLLGILDHTIGPFHPVAEPGGTAHHPEVPVTQPPPLPAASLTGNKAPEPPPVLPPLMPAIPELEAVTSAEAPARSARKQEKQELPTLDFELDLDEDFSQTLNLDMGRFHKE